MIYLKIRLQSFFFNKFRFINTANNEHVLHLKCSIIQYRFIKLIKAQPALAVHGEKQ